MQFLVGSVLDPHACWLLLRGIKTLAVRVQKQTVSALAIARLLSHFPEIQKVNYPYLESSPDHGLAKRQMAGGGGVISFEFKGGHAAAQAFVDALELIPIATSLGGVETVVEIPSDLDFSEEELGEAAREGKVSAGLIRLSVGIEDITDVLSDIQNGLAAVATSKAIERRRV